MKTITKNALARELKRLVQQHPDRTNPQIPVENSDETTCETWDADGNPSCFIGHALHALGLRLETVKGAGIVLCGRHPLACRPRLHLERCFARGPAMNDRDMTDAQQRARFLEFMAWCRQCGFLPRDAGAQRAACWNWSQDERVTRELLDGIHAGLGAWLRGKKMVPRMRYYEDAVQRELTMRDKASEGGPLGKGEFTPEVWG